MNALKRGNLEKYISKRETEIKQNMQTKTTHDYDKHDKGNMWNTYKKNDVFLRSDFLVHDVHRLKLNPFYFASNYKRVCST